MQINWAKLAFKIPMVVGFAMEVAEKFKVPGKTKEEAVIESLQKAPDLEEILDVDLVNDAALNGLLSNYITAKHASNVAKEAFMDGLKNAKALKGTGAAIPA